MIWETIETDAAAARDLSRQLDISTTLAHLLAQRGLSDVETAKAFLRPQLRDLGDPFQLGSMREAIDRIDLAISGEESIVIFGDYDVDGVTSTVQLVGLLRMFGAAPRYYVPRRLKEGYGLSRDAIDRVCEDGVPDLFIALDCGTNAHQPVAYLRSLGVDVVIVDHHQAKDGFPSGCILVNPHVHDDADAPWASLCTAGLAFKITHALMMRRRTNGDARATAERLKANLDLVAMGTIADLVPLSGENRILSWFGLRHLQANQRCGVRALADVAGLDISNSIVSADISFKLGPRINASGRLADAALPVEMLLDNDSGNCHRIARELEAMNRDRQAIERAIAKAAEQMVEADYMDAPGVVLYGADWHPGVVGIVASRVSRGFHKPCVILGAEGDLAKGSGRSVGEVDLVAVLKDCSDLLEHWGGHPMAVGVSLPVGHVERFREAFAAAIMRRHPDGAGDPILKVSAWLKAVDLDEPLLQELDRLHPFGEGNPEPVFGVRNAQFCEGPKRFGEGHFRFTLANGSRRGISGVAWRMEPPKPKQPVDLAMRLSWNVWRDRRYLQLTLVDWRPSR